MTKMFPFIQYFIGLAGVVGTDFYDFDLSQWGLNRLKKESWQDYVQRMRDHPGKQKILVPRIWFRWCS